MFEAIGAHDGKIPREWAFLELDVLTDNIPRSSTTSVRSIKEWIKNNGRFCEFNAAEVRNKALLSSA